LIDLTTTRKKKTISIVEMTETELNERQWKIQKQDKLIDETVKIEKELEKRLATKETWEI